MNKKNTHKVSLNQEIFDQAMKQKKYSISILNSQCDGMTSEGMLRRARKEGKIAPEVLEKIAECLNISPEKLSGSDLNNDAFIKELYKLLQFHGISKEQYNSLSKKEQETLHKEIQSAIQLILLKYF